MGEMAGMGGGGMGVGGEDVRICVVLIGKGVVDMVVCGRVGACQALWLLII